MRNMPETWELLDAGTATDTDGLRADEINDRAYDCLCESGSWAIDSPAWLIDMGVSHFREISVSASKTIIRNVQADW